jgi:hypothetical protein
MKENMKYRQGMVVAVGILAGLLILGNMALADSWSFKQLSAEWQQWVLSIPTPKNPMLDSTGENCMVGQRGDVWFLAGTFFGGAATRTCAVPEGTRLFFPVINSVFIDTPGVCGQEETIPVKDMRAALAAFWEGLQEGYFLRR